MTLRHMRIFAEVYRTRNVTHAAQNLHMTQPARDPRHPGTGTALWRAAV